MSHKLFITPGQEVIQIDKIAYKITTKNIEMNDLHIGHNAPARTTLSAFQSLALEHGKDIAERVRELAREYGAKEFHSFFDGVKCGECEHNNGNTAKDYSPCKYKPKIEQIRVFCTEKSFLGLKKKTKFFVANDLPCAVYDTFYIALEEKGHLERFRVEGELLENIPLITDIINNPKLEKQAIETYKYLRNIS